MTRYALNARALQQDSLPPEGPFDVALTNGLLAIVAEVDLNAVHNGKGRTLPASALLPIAVKMGLTLDASVLLDGLQVSQPMRHGNADDEWIALAPRHVQAVVDLDENEGLNVLALAEQHPKVDDLVVAVFEEKVTATLGESISGLDEWMFAPEPEEFEECWRQTFIPSGGFDASGGNAVEGFCLACGYTRTEDEAYDMYLRQKRERHKDD
jgi:hypothetical protein